MDPNSRIYNSNFSFINYVFGLTTAADESPAAEQPSNTTTTATISNSSRTSDIELPNELPVQLKVWSP